MKIIKNPGDQSIYKNTGIGYKPNSLLRNGCYQQRIHKVAAGVFDWHNKFAAKLEKKRAKQEEERKERIEKDIQSAGDRRKREP